VICLIDPALQDHAGTPSTNLGDVVIFRAIARCLERLFPGEEIRRISSHEPLAPHHYESLQSSRLTFLGGSNLLSSDLLEYNQWNFASGPADYERLKIDDALLFGIGWWQYQNPANAFTAGFYRRLLSPSRLHSVRDRYTAAKLREAGISNVVATGCPSMWGLDGVRSNRDSRWTDDCVVMLTDYYTNPADDETFLGIVQGHFEGTIYFFPQGTGDVAYLRTLPAFARMAHRLQILDHSLESLETLLRTHPVTYVGTRLHGGITALTHRVPSLILGVDNRATEMARDFHLPVIARKNTEGLCRWLRGDALFPDISVPQADVDRWCGQFSATLS
jgi:polysaccharide pyruvyl transferase WcaK-like protein